MWRDAPLQMRIAIYI